MQIWLILVSLIQIEPVQGQPTVPIEDHGDRDVRLDPVGPTMRKAGFGETDPNCWRSGGPDTPRWKQWCCDREGRFSQHKFERCFDEEYTFTRCCPPCELDPEINFISFAPFDRQTLCVARTVEHLADRYLIVAGLTEDDHNLPFHHRNTSENGVAFQDIRKAWNLARLLKELPANDLVMYIDSDALLQAPPDDVAKRFAEVVSDHVEKYGIEPVLFSGVEKCIPFEEWLTPGVIGKSPDGRKGHVYKSAGPAIHSALVCKELRRLNQDASGQSSYPGPRAGRVPKQFPEVGLWIGRAGVAAELYQAMQDFLVQEQEAWELAALNVLRLPGWRPDLVQVDVWAEMFFTADSRTRAGQGAGSLSEELKSETERDLCSWDYFNPEPPRLAAAQPTVRPPVAIHFMGPSKYEFSFDCCNSFLRAHFMKYHGDLLTDGDVATFHSKIVNFDEYTMHGINQIEEGVIQMRKKW